MLLDYSDVGLQEGVAESQSTSYEVMKSSASVNSNIKSETSEINFELRDNLPKTSNYRIAI